MGHHMESKLECIPTFTRCTRIQDTQVISARSRNTWSLYRPKPEVSPAVRRSRPIWRRPRGGRTFWFTRTKRENGWREKSTTAATDLGHTCSDGKSQTMGQSNKTGQAESTVAERKLFHAGMTFHYFERTGPAANAGHVRRREGDCENRAFNSFIISRCRFMTYA